MLFPKEFKTLFLLSITKQTGKTTLFSVSGFSGGDIPPCYFPGPAVKRAGASVGGGLEN
jgi:hypothetical protein